MATIDQYRKMTTKERQTRYFSEDFRRKKVSEIERNLVTVAEICREYQVSRTAVQKWIYKYSLMRKKAERQVVESKSDTKKISELKKEIAELQRRLGEKDIQMSYLEKMIELAEKDLRIDIKKKGKK